MSTLITELDDRLAFIRRFYLTAAPPFEALRRECIHTQDANDEDQPGEMEKWNDATKGLELIGQFSLSLVAKAIEDYLRHFITCAVGEVPKLTGKSRFEKYETFLLGSTDFRWPDCPIGRDRIEQINLCRNDFIHDPVIDGVQPRQSEGHFEKYPSSRFRDALVRAVEMAVAQVEGTDFEETPRGINGYSRRVAERIGRCEALL